MNYEIEFKEGFVVLRVSGQASAEGFEAGARALLSTPGWQPGTNILADYNELDLSHTTGDEVKIFAHVLASFKEKLGKGRIACVNGRPANFGLGRMWQVYMEEHSNYRVSIFYEMEEAERWLSGDD